MDGTFGKGDIWHFQTTYVRRIEGNGLYEVFCTRFGKWEKEETERELECHHLKYSNDMRAVSPMSGIFTSTCPLALPKASLKPPWSPQSNIAAGSRNMHQAFPLFVDILLLAIDMQFRHRRILSMITFTEPKASILT